MADRQRSTSPKKVCKEKIGMKAFSKGKPESSVSGKKKSARNRQREQARSWFDPDAPQIDLDSFFSGYSTVYRGNVEGELDNTIPEQSFKQYEEAISTKSSVHKWSDETENTMKVKTLSLLNLGLLRKLIDSTPASSKSQVEELNFISQLQIMLPSAYSILIDQIGKFDEDDVTFRIRDNVHEIYRLVVKLLKVAIDDGSMFKMNYPDELASEIRKLDISKTFFYKSDSISALRREAIRVVKTYMSQTFSVYFGDHELKMSYPRLELVDDVDKDKKNVLSWLGDVTPDHPNALELVAAGLLSVITPQWLKNPDAPIARFMPGVPEWIATLTSNSLLASQGLRVLDQNINLHVDETFGSFSLLDVLEDVVGKLTSAFTLELSGYIKLKPMTNQPFGTSAQLVAPDKSKIQPAYHGAPNDEFAMVPTQDVFSNDYFRVKHHSRVVLALAFRLMREVRVSPNYQARLSTRPGLVRSMLLSSDVIKT